jgi:hypothetical protein
MIANKQIAIFAAVRESPADNDLEYRFLIERIATNITVLTGDHINIFVSDWSEGFDAGGWTLYRVCGDILNRTRHHEQRSNSAARPYCVSAGHLQ